MATSATGIRSLKHTKSRRKHRIHLHVSAWFSCVLFAKQAILSLRIAPDECHLDIYVSFRPLCLNERTLYESHIYIYGNPRKDHEQVLRKYNIFQVEITELGNSKLGNFPQIAYHTP